MKAFVCCIFEMEHILTGSLLKCLVVSRTPFLVYVFLIRFFCACKSVSQQRECLL